ncbi:sensor domain-containing diguanylate cyclase [Lysobacter korlensis]|uniref:Sensor domain-containing diguanylate cyclase n=1 Tax=Lysobacter korlensis TaxID=553636 RepID=A0ABV6RQZ8_9GAMM
MEAILAQLADSISSARTLEDLTRPLLEMLEAVTGLESTYLTTIDLDKGFQHIVYARNSRQLQIPEGLSAPWEDTLCKRSLDEGRTFTDDVGTCWGDSEAARALGINTYVSTPVRTSCGELYGTLCAASSSRAPLTADAEKILGMFSQLIGQHVERERLLVQLQQANAELAASALTDPVTCLPNRRALLQELTRMLARIERDGSAIVVAFVDLDGFKAINDTYGHEAGDQLLAAVGQRILASRRAADLVARFGGDEFVVAAPVGPHGAELSAEAIRASLIDCTRGIYWIDGRDIHYRGASVGVAVANGGHADIEALLRRADASMYALKRVRSLGTAA